MKIFSTVLLVIIFIIALVYFLFGDASKFTAVIDGNEFKGEQGIARYSAGRLTVVAECTDPEKSNLLIKLNAAKAGRYLLNSDNVEAGNFAAYYLGKNVFASNSRYTGSVTITKLDFEEKAVSGTFTFQAVQVEPPGPKVVSVTDGTFEDMPIE